MCSIFVSAATAMIVFGVMPALAPAQADDIHGGPTRNGDQCFRYSPGLDRDARFGYWGACPQTASVPATTATNSPTTNRRRVRESAITELRLERRIGTSARLFHATAKVTPENARQQKVGGSSAESVR
jgi:hypothetical protein